MKNQFLLLLLFTFSYSISAQEISTVQLKKHILFLASDDLKGRGTGTADERIAAEYIQTKFSEFKLTPKGNSTGYFYNYTFKKPKDPHDTIGGETVSSIDVAGYLDNGAQNTVIIGAHFDHLGMGYDKNSLDPNPEGKIHNGADDNASGVAGVLELARFFSQNNRTEKFNFLFICFSGEELGLFGSRKFCENPSIDFLNVNYMINLDMIGRLNDSTKKLVIAGVGTAPDWVPMIREIKSDLNVKSDSAGIGPSDHTSFYLKNIPALFFFTGSHPDYHQTSDDVEKINFEGEKKVLNYIIDLEQKTELIPKLAFQKTKNREAETRKYKVTMGVMPDYTFDGKGMRIDAVTDGKPASKAGIHEGDIVIQLGETTVASTMDYMKALSNYNKGDTAEIKLMREGKVIKIYVTF